MGLEPTNPFGPNGFQDRLLIQPDAFHTGPKPQASVPLARTLEFDPAGSFEHDQKFWCCEGSTVLVLHDMLVAKLHGLQLPLVA